MMGSTLRSHRQRPLRRYRCTNTVATNGPICTQTADALAIERGVLDEVVAVIESLITDQRVQEGLRKAWQARRQASTPDNTSRMRALETRIEESRQRITRATELLVDGAIGKPAYDELVAKAQRDGAAAEWELAGLHASAPAAAKLPPFEEVIAAAGSWSTILAGVDIRAQRDVLVVLVERIVPVRESRGVYSATVTWTPLGVNLRSVAA